MKAVILAAGRGRRLGSGDDSAPKILLKFGGGSLLERHLAILHACGVAEAVIVVGFAADRIREEVARIGPAIPVPSSKTRASPKAASSRSRWRSR